MLNDKLSSNFEVDDWESRVTFDAHFYHGTTLDIVQHIVQIAQSHQFQLFDYGPEENMQRYGSEDAPRVPVENINIPLAVLLGKFNNKLTKFFYFTY